MVFASFKSPQLVPRDVVFGDYGTLGDVTESWTAPCYILSADFAAVLPADEDPMPLDGNPHPLPGQLHDHQGNFVLLQYPELGWDVPHQPQNDNVHDHIHEMQHDNMQVDQEQQDDQEQQHEIQDSGSAVFDVSDGSVNQQHNQIIINYMRFDDNSALIRMEENLTARWPSLLVGIPTPGYLCPELPPLMKWDRVFQKIMPFAMTATPGRVLQQFPLAKLAKLSFSKRDWVAAFKKLAGEQYMRTTDEPRKQITARKLCFEESETTCTEDVQTNSNFQVDPITTAVDATEEVNHPRKRGRKCTPEVQSMVRRSTRQSTKANGYKLEPMRDRPTPKKKAKSARPQQDEPVTPHTPISILQRVGRNLEIPEEEITVERLDANLDASHKPQGGSDD